MNLESIHNEIYQKIGKNIMLFQKLEMILKHINLFKGFKAPSCKIIEEKEKLKDSIQKKSMGILINEFLYKSEGTLKEDEENSKETFFFFDVDLSPYFMDEKIITLKYLLEERNKLIHHAYTEFNMDTVISCTAIIDFLDNQQVRIKNEINTFIPIIKTIEKLKKELVEAFKSDEFKEEFFWGWIRTSNLIIEIINIYEKTVKENGWASFSMLGIEIRKNALKEVELLKEKYQCKSLKELLIKTKMFDFHLEGTFVLYRIKPEFLRATSH